MTTKKTTAVATIASEENLVLLRDQYPVEDSYQRVLLPRLSFASQDVTEGKGKAMKVVIEAGTFSTEKETDELDENGKKIWEKNELGKEIEVIVLFERKQLKFYDGEKYTSSPIYDSKDQIIPLFRDKQEVARGTPDELRKREEFQGTTAKGKATSKLEENKILYVLYADEMYQMNLRGTSMYAFSAFKRKVSIPTIITRINSESKENGAIAWNQMTFESVRTINGKEADQAVELLAKIKDGIAQEQAFFASKTALPAGAKAKDEDF